MTREEAITTLDILLATEKAAYKGLIPRENSLHITEIEALDMLLKEALQERQKGRWIENRTATYNAYTDDFEEVPHYNCSLCDCPMDWKAPFCPECGASMVGADMRESE